MQMSDDVIVTPIMGHRGVGLPERMLSLVSILNTVTDSKDFHIGITFKLGLWEFPCSTVFHGGLQASGQETALRAYENMLDNFGDVDPISVEELDEWVRKL